MRERDLNCIPKQGQLHRLKDILFPKKSKSRIITQIEQCVETTPENNGFWIRSQISRLRGQIYSMMQKGKNTEGLAMETERAYLNGINQLSKNLKNYTQEINEAFDDFISHLPTTSLHKKNYSNSYYLSMLIQNATWSRIQKILKRPMAVAFHLLRSQNMEKRQEIFRMERNQLEFQTKIKNRLFQKASQYFNRWRYNSMCIGLTHKSQEYLKENNLEYDRKIQQSLLNFPLLVLILEELARQTADISQLLAIDDKKAKACKFMEQGQSHLNSSIQTVTQRSILQAGDNTSRKFNRFEFNLISSLTKTCLQRGQIMFVSSLSKNIDYSEIDNSCLWQAEGKGNNYLKGGAVFYPLFDSNSQCIGILRQYFYETPIKALNPEKIEKIRTLLELGISLQKKMIHFGRQKQYQKQGYYLKMISLIKRIEIAKGQQTEIMSTLFQELQTKLGISKLSIYKVQRAQGEGRGKNIILQSIFGQSQECSLLLAMVDQLMKQQQSHVYLQNRLLIYSKLMLFDLQLDQNQLSSVTTRKQNKILPVEMIVNVMSKIQSVLAIKKQQFRAMEQETRQSVKQQREVELKQLDQVVKKYSIQLLVDLDEDNTILQSIAAYLKNIWNSLDKFQFITKEEYKNPIFYLECITSKSRREKVIFYISTQNMELTEIQRSQWNQLSSSFIKISLSQLSILFIDFRLKEGLKYLEQIRMIIGQYINNYFHLTQQLKTKTWKTNDIMEQFHRTIRQLSFPYELVQMKKKSYELELIKTIYFSFNRAVSLFCQTYFGSSDQPIWQKSQPQMTNLQEWKQLLYKSILTDSSLIQIDIINKNPVIPVEEYQTLKLITDGQLTFIKRQCWLAIGNSPVLVRAKNFAYNEQLLMKLPIYFFFSREQPQNQSLEWYVKEGLNKLKQIWLKLSKSLLQFNTFYNEGCLLRASAKIAVTMQKLKGKNLRSSFTLLNKFRLAKVRSIKSSEILLNILQNYEKSMLVFSVSKMLSYCADKGMLKTKQYLNKLNIFNLCSLSSNLLFLKPFERIKDRLVKKQKIEAGLICVEKLYNSIQTSIKQQTFTDVLYFTRRYTLAGIVVETINTMTKIRLNFSLQKLLQQSSKSSVATLEKEVFSVETCKSLKSISKEIHNMTPFYSLYLIINEDSCYPLHNPNNISYELIATEQVYSSAPPSIIYQIGSQSRLIWIYFVDEGQTCFQIKDKLNYISKCIEAGLKNCREEIQIRLNSLSAIKKSFVRSLKVSYWKKWRQQSSKMAMQEQNRLNDSLYQISLQSQTIKEKLKGQEKALKNNFICYQQLQRKQEEYKSSITYNSAQARRIEEAQTKLQNARVLSNILHHRTVIKSCFLLWRSNSLVLKLTQIRKKRVQNSPYIKMALNSIFSILPNWYQSQLNEVFLKICIYRKQAAFKIKSVQKLSVSFQEKGSRLITFQSNLIEQQNSSRQGNSLQQSEYSQDGNQSVGGKFKLSKMQHEKTICQLSAQQMSKYNNGAYKLNPKTLKFLKRMGKLQN